MGLGWTILVRARQPSRRMSHFSHLCSNLLQLAKLVVRQPARKEPNALLVKHLVRQQAGFTQCTTTADDTSTTLLLLTSRHQRHTPLLQPVAAAVRRCPGWCVMRRSAVALREANKVLHVLVPVCSPEGPRQPHTLLLHLG